MCHRRSERRAKRRTSLSSGRLLACAVASLVGCAVGSSVGGGAGSQHRYNAYNYDMTTPQFTPDGRLLQVEYASSASQHSPPLIVLQVDSFGPSDAERTRKRGVETDGNSGGAESASDVPLSRRPDRSAVVLLSPCRSLQSAQQRLVVVDEPASVRRESAGTEIVVAMSGVLSDSLALLQTALDDRFERYRMFGGTDRMSDREDLSSDVAFGHTAANEVLQTTKAIADKCQRHSFGGGIRPFGHIMLVAGIVHGRIHVYQTDPSGAILPVIHPHDFASTSDKSTVLASTSSHHIALRWIVGGSASQQAQLRSNLEKAFRRQRRFGLNLRQSMTTTTNPSLATFINRAGTELLRCLNDNIDDSAPKHNDETRRQLDAADRNGSRFNSIEAVVLSNIDGIHQVTREQISQILSQHS